MEFIRGTKLATKSGIAIFFEEIKEPRGEIAELRKKMKREFQKYHASG